jgi:hypothetical protein
MGTTYRFISALTESEEVCTWFRGLDPQPVEQTTDGGVIFYFKHLGPISDEAGCSPIVNVILPRNRRGVLTTAGEVHFLATPSDRFPELAKVSRAFRKWISQNPLLHSRIKARDDSLDDYLEGSLRNWDSEIFGLPDGIKALQAGSYFVAADDSEARVDDLCKQLQLRGVEAIQEAEQEADDQLPTRAESEAN